MVRSLTSRLAAVCPAYGPPETVEVREVAEPRPGPGEVRVRVQAAAVNFPDVLVIANQYQISVSPPFVPGSDFAGAVVEVADGVREVVVGDRVFGSVMVGAFAQHVVAGSSMLTRSPTASRPTSRRPSAWRTGPRTTCSDRSPACRQARTWWCWVPVGA